MEILNKSGIYLICNSVTEQIYVGQSKNVRRRLAQHKSGLISNRHRNAYLQSSFNKYGEDKFVFRPMEYCGPEAITDREQYWINQFDSMNRIFGFNLKEAGETGKLSKESCAKLSITKTGIKIHSEESRAKISAAGKGNTYNKGKVRSEEFRAKVSAARKGKTPSEETRAKISAAAKNRWKKSESLNYL